MAHDDHMAMTEAAPSGGLLPPGESLDAVEKPTIGTVRGQTRVKITVAVLLALSGLFVAVATTLPSDGTATAAATSIPDGVRVTRLARTGVLQDGDVVVKVEGSSLADRILPRAHIGDSLKYLVRRPPGYETTVTVTIGRYPVRFAVVRHWPTLVVIGSFLALAGYVFGRRPDDHAARVLIVGAALGVCAATSWIFGLQVIHLGGGPGWWANLGGGIAFALLWGWMVHFVLVFPAPLPLLVRRPRLAAAPYLVPVVLYGLHVAISYPQASTPLQRSGVLAATTTRWIGLVVAPLLLVGVVGAYRRADPDARGRLRAVLAWIALCAMLEIALWSAPNLLGHPLVRPPLHPLVFLPCPLAIAAAVLRQRLFEIDIVVRRSLVFAGLTGCVAAIYIATVAALGWLFHFDRSWAGLVATGILAVIVSPLHQRLGRAVSHLVYGWRDDPFAIVAQLAQRLERIASPDDVLPSLVETLATTLRLPYAAIELDYRDGTEQAAHHGELRGEPLVLPLVFRGERLGRLVIGQRSVGEPFSRPESHMLADLASQAGVAAHAVRLTRDLQRSRERLVTDIEEERRRLRRDLHDVTAPTVAAAAVEIEALRRLTVTDPTAAATLAGRLAVTVKAAVADIRHLVYNLRPPALDQLGLVSALREQANNLATADTAALSVNVQAEGDVAHLPAAVEVAAYCIACEALHNVYRHAEASSCTVRMTVDRALDLEVFDDGSGLRVEWQPGEGLASMRERAAELGGTCTVEAGRSGGTVVRAHLPLAPR